MAKLPVKKVADYLWRKDGEPERDGPGTAYRGLYEQWARDVLNGLRSLGYSITPPRTAIPQDTTKENADGVE